MVGLALSLMVGAVEVMEGAVGEASWVGGAYR